MPDLADTAKLVVLPPFGLSLLVLIGWLTLHRRRTLGMEIPGGGFANLYFLRTPLARTSLLDGLEIDRALELERAEAIVMPGAGMR